MTITRRVRLDSGHTESKTMAQGNKTCTAGGLEPEFECYVNKRRKNLIQIGVEEAKQDLGSFEVFLECSFFGELFFVFIWEQTGGDVASPRGPLDLQPIPS